MISAAVEIRVQVRRNGQGWIGRLISVGSINASLLIEQSGPTAPFAAKRVALLCGPGYSVEYAGLNVFNQEGEKPFRMLFRYHLTRNS